MQNLAPLTILAWGGVETGQKTAGIRVDAVEPLDDLRESILDLGLLLDLLLQTGKDDWVDEGSRVGHGEGIGQAVLLGEVTDLSFCQRQVLSGQASSLETSYGKQTVARYARHNGRA